MSKTKAAYDHILQDLQEAFPQCWFKPGKDFDGGTAAAWSGEGGEVDGDYAFDHNRMEWSFGAHPKLAKFVEDRGFHWEAHDPGTFLLYED
ncbi:MAG: hypothetical protein JRJ69_15700 [Deltaproteobacteria bacterium]|nr:hypothetical protein [Deltaproteobacteria bacterium]